MTDFLKLVMLAIGLVLLVYGAWQVCFMIGWRSGIGQPLCLRDRLAYGAVLLGFAALLWSGFLLR